MPVYLYWLQVLVSDDHVVAAVSSSTDCRSWVCVADLASCAVVYAAEMAGHVTAGAMTSSAHAHLCAGGWLHVYALRPDIRLVDRTQLGADVRAIAFTQVRTAGLPCRCLQRLLSDHIT